MVVIRKLNNYLHVLTRYVNFIRYVSTKLKAMPFQKIKLYEIKAMNFKFKYMYVVRKTVNVDEYHEIIFLSRFNY